MLEDGRLGEEREEESLVVALETRFKLLDD